MTKTLSVMAEERTCGDCVKRGMRQWKTDAEGHRNCYVYCRHMAGMENRTVKLNVGALACRNFWPREKGDAPDDGQV